MADRYLKATGNWADNNTWSATDGGAAGASFPTSADNAYITANGNGLTLTVDVNLSACLSLVCSGATTATLAIPAAVSLLVGGSITFTAEMTVTGVNATSVIRMVGTGTLTTAGLSLGCGLYAPYGGGVTITLAGDTVVDYNFSTYTGTLTTNNYNITCGSFINATTGTTYNLGSSTITCTGSFALIATSVINAGTSTIKVGLDFNGQSKTYNNVELNGAACTISGSNTFNTLTFKADTTQTLTFTDGTTQTITTPVFTGSSGKVKTLVGSSTGGWTITKAGGGTVDADYLALSYSEATPGQTWYTANSTDTVGNSGWIFAWLAGNILGVTVATINKINGVSLATINKINGVSN
ncbi:hypothetical protein LCGC14_0420780 [marine sediment metagenome]|uniref:Uncharacterized protein n=1 Tax=marine sediment metagenome TaxID=412755 RepID=A0A0F9SX72_9ZZZZ